MATADPESADIADNAKIREILEKYRTSLDETERTELNTIITWVAFSESSVTLAGIAAVLEKSCPNTRSLEENLRGKYSSLFRITREDGLSTEALRTIRLYLRMMGRK